MLDCLCSDLNSILEPCTVGAQTTNEAAVEYVKRWCERRSIPARNSVRVRVCVKQMNMHGGFVGEPVTVVVIREVAYTVEDD